MKYIKKPTDLRVKKTKNNICSAYLKLLTKKEFRSITITDIANMADINRKTFYHYYESIDDVIREIIDESLFYLFGNRKIDFEEILKNPKIIFERFNELIEADFDTYTVLFKIEEPVNLLQKVEIMMKEKMIEFFLEKNPEDTANIMVFSEFCSAGIMSAYRYWFNSSQKIPLEELSKKICCMIESCMESLDIKW